MDKKYLDDLDPAQVDKETMINGIKEQPEEWADIFLQQLGLINQLAHIIENQSNRLKHQEKQIQSLRQQSHYPTTTQPKMH